MTNEVSDPTTRFSAALASHYVIERELGAGGMAIVYLARDVRDDRRVALKVLRPELAAQARAITCDVLSVVSLNGGIYEGSIHAPRHRTASAFGSE